jgi:hypothetical protein
MRVKCLVEEYTEVEKRAYKRSSEDNTSKISDIRAKNEDLKKSLANNKEKLKTAKDDVQKITLQRNIHRDQTRLNANTKQLSNFQIDKANILSKNKLDRAQDIEKQQIKKAEEEKAGPPAAGGVVGQAATQAATGALTGGDWKTAGTIGLGALAVYGAWKSYKYWKQKRAEAKTEKDRKQAEEKMAKEREKIRKEREKK